MSTIKRPPFKFEAKKNPPSIRTKEVAEALGVTTHTIRNWVKDELIPAPPRSPGGHRLWRESDIEMLLALASILRRRDRRPRQPEEAA